MGHGCGPDRGEGRRPCVPAAPQEQSEVTPGRSWLRLDPQDASWPSSSASASLTVRDHPLCCDVSAIDAFGRSCYGFEAAHPLPPDARVGHEARPGRSGPAEGTRASGETLPATGPDPRPPLLPRSSKKSMERGPFRQKVPRRRTGPWVSGSPTYR